MSPDAVVAVLELVGLYVFATSGALMAIHKGFDVVGIVILAMVVVATCAAVAVFLFRLLAMLRHWTAPQAWRRSRR